jgi:hypothetical protein
MTETPEGFLICHDVPIARTGKQDYLAREIGGQGEDMIPVLRIENEVFSQAAMASFEGKPVTEDHPPIPVTSENSSVYAKGHVQNVHRGSGNESDLLLADLFITDAELIRAIKNGLREVSCGYECDYAEDERGRFYQCRIRGNHVAVVAAGRAGSRVSIKDSKPNKKGEFHMDTKKKTSIVARLFAHWATDAQTDPAEVAEAVDALIETEEPQTGDNGENTGAVPAQSKPEQPVVKTVTEQADADIDSNAQLASLLKQVLAKLNGGAVDADPNADPLEQLEDDLGSDPEAQNQLPPPEDQEASQTVPAEELAGTDADPEEGEENKPFQNADSAGTLAAIKAMKPYLAKLNAKDRRMASDSIAKAVRRARGMNTTPVIDGYAALLRNQSANARKRAKDSKAVDDTVYGANCAKRNPHMSK